MNDSAIKIIGSIAQVLFMICQWPQIYKVFKLKKTTGISRIYLSIAISGYLLNLIYMIHIKQPILIIGTVMGLLSISTVFIGTLIYRD